MDMECFLLLVESLDRVQSRIELDRMFTIRTAHHGDQSAFRKAVQALQKRMSTHRVDTDDPEAIANDDHERLKRDLAAGLFGGVKSKY